MNIVQLFDDPRHRASEERTDAAQSAEWAGDFETAKSLYAEAARLEEAHAFDVPGDDPRLRAMFGVSAVALWLRAERWDDAARVGCALLAAPDKLGGDGVHAIQKLVDRAWRTREVERALGEGGQYMPIEATLSGGLVRQGLAPSNLVGEYRDVLAPLLIRVAEWRSQKKYRRTGPSALTHRYDIFEAPAIGSSYALRLYVGADAAQLADGIAPPNEIVEQFLALAAAASNGPDELRALVGDDAYTKAFLRSFRELAPDGKNVGRVEFGAMVRGKTTVAASLNPETRERLTRALRTHEKQEKPIECVGVLKTVNIRGDEPRIAIDTPDGVRHFRIAKGEHDDTIGPKFNRMVRIVGMRRVNEFQEADEWADDVVLLEESSGASPT